MLRNLKHLVALLLTALFVGCADEPSSLPAYEAQQFQQKIDSGQPVVLHIYSTYCSPCHAQNDVLASLSQDSAFQHVAFYHLDFDAQKEQLKKYHITEQSVILLFKNGKERARIDQITDPEKIRSTLLQAL